MSDTIAVKYGTLHSCDGEPRTNGTLLIEGGMVASLDTPSVPEGALRFEAACVVPGLINAHAHLEASGEPDMTGLILLTTPTQRAYICAENARKALAAGVTTMRDLGGTERLAIDLRDAINAGKLAGPTIVAAGRVVCMTGGHGWWIGREADGPWDVRKAVREQRKDGADCIKFMATGGVLTKGSVPAIAQLTEDEMRAGVEEAHNHGMRTAAHAIGALGIRNALRAGIDSIEHGHLLDDEAIALFHEHGAYLLPTLSAIASIVDAGTEGRMPDWVLRKALELATNAIENLRKAYQAGVKIAGGSDAGTPYNPHELYWREVRLMHEQLGMTPREALYAATASAGELLAVDRGRVRKGSPADVLLLERDAGDRPDALSNPQVVIKNGAVAFDHRP